MPSTNKTTHYELNQYKDTDKPTYLGDYNSDMQKIDLAIKEVDTKTEDAVSKSEIANTNSMKAINDSSEALTKIKATEEDVATAINTAISANNKSDGAVSKADSALIIATTIKIVTDSLTVWQDKGDITAGTHGNIYCKYNPTLKLMSLYGSVYNVAQGNNRINFGVLPEGLRPKTDRVISAGAMVTDQNNLALGVKILPININTSGQVYITITDPASQSINVQLMLNVSDWF